MQIVIMSSIEAVGLYKSHQKFTHFMRIDTWFYWESAVGFSKFLTFIEVAFEDFFNESRIRSVGLRNELFFEEGPDRTVLIVVEDG